MVTDSKPVGSKPPKLALVTGLVLLFLALSSCGVGGLSCASFAGSFAGAVSGSSSVALGESTTLEAESSSAVVLASSSRVLCLGEDEFGTEIQFSEPSPGSSGTITSGSDTLTFTYSFDTDPGIIYEVTCEQVDSADGQYAIASFPGFSKLGFGLAGFVGGAFLTFCAAIFLIIGLVQRSKWKIRQSVSGGVVPPQAPPLGPPALPLQ